MTDRQYLKQLRTPTKEDPLRILVSSCLTGILCGVDGSSNGEYPSVLRLLNYDNVKLIPFCPEDYSFGTPREMCDIFGGTGLDVLNGKAKVLTEMGIDWTEGMIKASERMLQIALRENIELGVMMDISAACGSQVIYDGSRYSENKKYQIGTGVCAAQLIRAGFKIISQRDFAALEILYSKIDPGHLINIEAKDHDEGDWYKDYFKQSVGIDIVKADITDIEDLMLIARETFLETFSPENKKENMEKYLAEELTFEKLTAEMNNQNSEFYFAFLKNKIIGYLKLNFGEAQTELKEKDALEIERIYVLNAFHGKEVGQILCDKAYEVARKKNTRYIWLGVWEKNLRAIRFYQKNGFEEFDKHIFKLGDEEQIDIMMKLFVPPIDIMEA